MGEVKADPAGLVPGGEGPAAGMGEAAMLHHIGVAFAIDVALEKGAAVEVAEGSGSLCFEWWSSYKSPNKPISRSWPATMNFGRAGSETRTFSGSSPCAVSTQSQVIRPNIIPCLSLFIFQAYPPTIKLIVVSPVDTSLLIFEIR